MKRPVVLLVLAIAACGNSSSSSPDGSPAIDAAPQAVERYFPMRVGATWEYQVTENGIVGTKSQTVLALEDIGGVKAGVMAYKVQTIKPNGKTTLSWQEDTGTALIRHREDTFAADQSPELEEFYVPSKLRLDEAIDHLSLGASFDVSYDEQVEDLILGGGVATLTKTETWTVEAVDLSTTVPAGTFSCIQIRKTSAVAGSDKAYWFARGVGKVREQSATQVEELSSYAIP